MRYLIFNKSYIKYLFIEKLHTLIRTFLADLKRKDDKTIPSQVVLIQVPNLR